MRIVPAKLVDFWVDTFGANRCYVLTHCALPPSGIRWKALRPCPNEIVPFLRHCPGEFVQIFEAVLVEKAVG